MKLVNSDNPILKKKCVPWTQVPSYLDLMRETMIQNNGVGIAAPQVGISESAFVTVFGDFINPEIKWYSKGKSIYQEGCLSLPGVLLPVERSNHILLWWYDRYGKLMKRKFTGIEARIIQHEYDHLQGILITNKQ